MFCRQLAHFHAIAPTPLCESKELDAALCDELGIKALIAHEAHVQRIPVDVVIALNGWRKYAADFVLAEIKIGRASCRERV